MRLVAPLDPSCRQHLLPGPAKRFAKPSSTAWEDPPAFCKRSAKVRGLAPAPTAAVAKNRRTKAILSKPGRSRGKRKRRLMRSFCRLRRKASSGLKSSCTVNPEQGTCTITRNNISICRKPTNKKTNNSRNHSNAKNRSNNKKTIGFILIKNAIEFQEYK